MDQLQIHKVLKRYSHPNFVDEGFKTLRALLRIRAMHINSGREGEGRAESKYCGAVLEGKSRHPHPVALRPPASHQASTNSC